MSPRARGVRGVAAAVLGWAILGGCAPAGDQPAPPAPTELVVFVAASLRAAAEEAATTYAGTGPPVTIRLAADSSAALRVQIEQGAPADLFLSADTRNPRALADAGLADGEPVPFAANLLVLAVPASNPAAVETPADLARPGVHVVAAGEQVPISIYAGGVVERLAALDGYPPGFAAGYRANIVSREDNATAVVTKLRLGEGDAGFVYATDVLAAGPDLRSVPIPVGANVAAVYAGVVVRTTAHQEAARAFLAWLAGPAGRAILARWGFQAP